MIKYLKNENFSVNYAPLLDRLAEVDSGFMKILHENN